MNHANTKMSQSLRDTNRKVQADVFNSKASILMAKDDQTKISRFIDCIRLHARLDKGHVLFDFHLPDCIKKVCEMENLKVINGATQCVVKWA